MTYLTIGTRTLAMVLALAAAPIASAMHATPVAAPELSGPATHATAAAGDTTRRDAELAEAGRRFAPSVRHCYSEHGLKEDPTMGGLLRVGLTVLPAGNVGDASATARRVHGLGMPAVTACVATAARSWRFRSGAPRTERVVLWFDLLPPSA